MKIKYKLVVLIVIFQKLTLRFLSLTWKNIRQGGKLNYD